MRSSQRKAIGAVAACLTLLASCADDEITLRYTLDGIDPGAIAEVTTVLTPLAPRAFATDISETSLGDGIRYEVRCPACSDGLCDPACDRAMIITFDRQRGFQPAPRFELRFRDNEHHPAQAVHVEADVFDEEFRSLLRQPPSVDVRIVGKSTVDLYLRAGIPCGETSCLGTQVCCETPTPSCVDLTSDAASCGVCGVACGPGETCVGGTCHCADGPGCRAGETCCGAAGCLDTKGDPRSCGGCGASCNDGETCEDGTCTCASNGGAACAVGSKCCAGAQGGCVAAGTACICGGGACALDQVCCIGAGSQEHCVDLATDETSCGACGTACPADLTCTGGQCTCKGSSSRCTDTCCADGCRRLADDSTDCGACGKACDVGDGERCVAASCACGAPPVACPSDALCCAGQCKAHDMSNCRGCGQGCSAAVADGCGLLGGQWTCRCGAGQACAAGQRCCGGTCVPEALNGDTNCGACGNDCTKLGSTYHCQGTPPACVQTTCSPSCSNGNACIGGTCKCGGGPACTGGTLCCDSTCVDSTTVAHCHSCSACATGETCEASGCSCAGGPACPANRACCFSGCTDLSSDPNNCASCIHSCGGTAATCVLGKCYGCAMVGGGTCAPGYGCIGNTCVSINASQCPTRTGTTACSDSDEGCCYNCFGGPPDDPCAVDGNGCAIKNCSSFAP